MATVRSAITRLVDDAGGFEYVETVTDKYGKTTSWHGTWNPPARLRQIQLDGNKVMSETVVHDGLFFIVATPDVPLPENTQCSANPPNTTARAGAIGIFFPGLDATRVTKVNGHFGLQGSTKTSKGDLAFKGELTLSHGLVDDLAFSFVNPGPDEPRRSLHVAVSKVGSPDVVVTPPKPWTTDARLPDDPRCR